MSGGHRTARAALPISAEDAFTTAPGTTRYDLVCRPEIVETAVSLLRRWAEDRALNEAARQRFLALSFAGLTHGLRYDPRGLTVLMRWLDPDRVRLDLRWLGGLGVTRTTVAESDLECTESTFDALADDWGFGLNPTGWVHWSVIDTS
jgi:hypothetical protein